MHDHDARHARTLAGMADDWTPPLPLDVQADNAGPPVYSYCGEPEPTEDCERAGWCDYHLGAMPSGPAPWAHGTIVPFPFGSDPARVAPWPEAAANLDD